MGGTVLVVEDDADIVELLELYLTGGGYDVISAKDGVEALELLRERTADVALVDIMMPRMNGYELCSCIKGNPDLAYIQVILLTARTDEQSHMDGYKTGADAYVEKPFEPDDLLEVIRNRLFLREQLKSRYVPVSPTSEGPVSSADEAFLYKINNLIRNHLSEELLLPFCINWITSRKFSSLRK